MLNVRSLLFVADATKLGTSLPFLLKLVCVAIGVGTAIAIKRLLFDTARGAAGAGRGKLLAITSLVAWTAAVTAGRLLAYL